MSLQRQNPVARRFRLRESESEFQLTRSLSTPPLPNGNTIGGSGPGGSIVGPAPIANTIPAPNLGAPFTFPAIVTPVPVPGPIATVSFGSSTGHTPGSRFSRMPISAAFQRTADPSPFPPLASFAHASGSSRAADPLTSFLRAAFSDHGRHYATSTSALEAFNVHGNYREGTPPKRPLEAMMSSGFPSPECPALNPWKRRKTDGFRIETTRYLFRPLRGLSLTSPSPQCDISQRDISQIGPRSRKKLFHARWASFARGIYFLYKRTLIRRTEEIEIRKLTAIPRNARHETRNSDKVRRAYASDSDVAALEVELSETREELAAARSDAKLEATVVDIEGKLKLARAEAKSSSSGCVRAPRASVSAATLSATSHPASDSGPASAPGATAALLTISSVAADVMDSDVAGGRRVSARKRAQADPSGGAPLLSNNHQKKFEDPLGGGGDAGSGHRREAHWARVGQALSGGIRRALQEEPPSLH
ncbi:hypothetical protein DFH09DRAFT_1424045 [Mycena vulgaris]|nr:hypothetical protein DFH09DRAFT_1424045 [Mycena vulgaris]